MNLTQHSPTRRLFLRALSAAATLPLVSLVISGSSAEANGIGFLDGTWIVRCRRGHDDQVEDITRNHDCEHDCDEKSVDDGSANVVCPDGHATHVEGITRSHLCTYPLPQGGVCGKQCRR